MEKNPSQSDAAAEGTDDGWYTQNPAALRYAEVWRLSSGWPQFLVAALVKTLKIKTPDHSAFKALDPAKVVGDHELTPRAREELGKIVADCRRAGMELAFYSTVERRDRSEGFAAHLLNRDGTSTAIATWAVYRARQVSKESSLCGLQSYLNDGTIFSTANRRRMLDAPSIFRQLHLPGVTVDELVRRHHDRLLEAGLDRVRRIDREELLDLLNNNKRRIAEFHIARGFWLPKSIS